MSWVNSVKLLRKLYMFSIEMDKVESFRGGNSKFVCIGIGGFFIMFRYHLPKKYNCKHGVETLFVCDDCEMEKLR